MAYAQNTAVSVDRSKSELERLLAAHGATAFSYGWDGDVAVVVFRAHDRTIKFEMPTPQHAEFERTPTGRRRTSAQASVEAEKELRRRWRSLVLIVKAKLEAVECGLVAFEDEFLAHVLLPNGRTVSEEVRPAIAESYRTGAHPRLLGMGSS